MRNAECGVRNCPELQAFRTYHPERSRGICILVHSSEFIVLRIMSPMNYELVQADSPLTLLRMTCTLSFLQVASSSFAASFTVQHRETFGRFMCGVKDPRTAQVHGAAHGRHSVMSCAGAGDPCTAV
jgi:hypothetical protein